MGIIDWAITKTQKIEQMGHAWSMYSVVSLFHSCYFGHKIKTEGKGYEIKQSAIGKILETQ
jgi:hypothetical protein